MASEELTKNIAYILSAVLFFAMALVHCQACRRKPPNNA